MSGQANGQVRAFQPALLKSEMARMGLKDEQVAVALNVRVKSIERWRRGENQPHENNVRALAGVFGRTAEWFYTEPEREAA